MSLRAGDFTIIGMIILHIYILGRRLIIVEDLVAVRITRMFVMSSHGGKTKVDLPPSYFRTWLTLGNKGDWL